MGRRKTETASLLVRVPVEVIERIDALTETYGRRSRNEIAADVLETYLPFWEELERDRTASLTRQRSALQTPRTGGAAAGDNFEPVDMFVPEPIRVPVIGGKRAPEKLKATGEMVPAHHTTTRKGAKTK